MGWLFLKETITPFEVIAMMLSFGGVVIIAMSNSITSKAEQAVDGADDDTGKQILGSGLIFLTSWCYAFVSILTRKM